MRPIVMHRFAEEADRQNRFDVVIIGGGITGAAAAYEAASRGYSVALLEKGDFGGATSSATGKLIHGGLRYLKRFDLSLVREALRERRILSNIAPNLVYPFPMVLANPGLLERMGLFVYDLLSFDRNRTWDKSKRIPSHKLLSKDEIRNKNLGNMEKAIYFYDCIMLSPERLTLHFLKSAVRFGAKLSNYTKMDEFLWEGDRVVGVAATDTLNGNRMELRSDVVVNASGPWIQDLLNRDKRTETPLPKERSEGIYLITKKYFDVMTLHVGKKGHFSFAPWRNHNMIGPTEKAYYGSVEDWKLSRESILEFLDAINSSGLLPQKLGIEDVQFAYGGLRPLAETSGKGGTYSASRKSELQDHGKEGIQGLITAGGGKYTTSRDFAEKIFSLIRKKIRKKPGPKISSRKHLEGCEISDIESYLSESKKNNSDFSENTVDYLVRHYGTESETILDSARSSGDLARVLDEDGEILAQVFYALRYEMAKNLEDIFLRRTGLGTLGCPEDSVLESVAALAASELGWSEEKKRQELDSIRSRLKLYSVSGNLPS
ncbi:glycerol-3-phosphate dehydrogenase/oxidase [Leptospira wolffii]|uniref:glycerol-3-phosphate dehydrogenase/oxidase n=1 Tax=Leptospira wolffii TaxID=409998 RepID=UPI001083CDCF|nr:glycerol-3-phosphate dehydrogenase/oxidase [Leptospira wolffii]TGK55937.1 glycerol-3-phosphate dehydrogenase/oxidase [Leptospira wolffii]TGK71983.1 glycerol-3-phosphate dehydrogenase/oxidase [Leptospira wolffii]TGK78637.1 glycerol-3-phosphate dehydrogenase/oxidase [Leptospira wolffii]TGL27560.1 glycerol-3-phosphate dehydrogenase/oxidase [Leptospira wolffii]